MLTLLRRVATAVALLCVGTVAWTGPAQAHPFGDPQTVTITADDDPRLVHVSWRVGAIDDLALLADFLGLVPGGIPGGTVDLLEASRAARSLADAPEFLDYLTEHLVATRADQACRTEIGPVNSLVSEGAEITFVCPRSDAPVSLAITTLTDLHPAYRTFATGPGGRHAVYDTDHPSHDWTLTATETTDAASAADTQPSMGRSAAVQLSVTGGAIAGLVAGGWLWQRTRRKRALPA